ncbi:MAG: glycosyltransferase [Chitinophagaceae bacterium]|nr:glycosyltransferase [Chitinophagaceae bacterium]
MKILRIIPSMNPKYGGPCQGIRNSIPEMQKLGIVNEVVCMDVQDSNYLGKDNFFIHALGRARGPWAYHKGLILWLQNNFERFDVVIIHGIWSYHSYAAYKALAIYKKSHKRYPKLYVMPHGMLDPYFQKAKDRIFKAIRNRIYWKLIESAVINNADGLLFTCEEELLLARTTFAPYRPKSEINVGYGIQSPPPCLPMMKQKFSEKVSKWNGKPFILSLSRIHPKKGIDLLVKAYQQLEKENVVLPQLIIAGPGLNTAYGKEIEKLASASENIHFIGMLTGDVKWSAFYGCECFILPSHQENFGIAVVEAMACGKPVLISNKVNIYKEIERGKSGLVESDTLDGVLKLLIQWISFSEKIKQEYSINARKTYMQEFTNENAVKKMTQAIFVTQACL